MFRFALAITTALSFAAISCNEGRPHGAGMLSTSPDTVRRGDDGDDGPFGVAHVTLTAQSRVTDPLEIDVEYPALADGRLDRARAPYPAVVFVQGGLVEAARYGWMARHLASRGYVVLRPHHALGLAIFETDNANIAITSLRRAAADSSTDATLAGAVDARGPVAYMGHSLGGVVAVRQWIDSDATAVVMLASYPADGDPVMCRAGSPVLSLLGANDTRKSPLANYEAGFRTFAEPRWMGLIAGMNHYAWCDDATAGELATDGALDRPLADVRRDALRMLDTFLDAVLRNDTAARTRLDAGVFANVTVSR
jgi:predicted dienelactone hydrolase